jgi:molybdopterin-binding protein
MGWRDVRNLRFGLSQNDVRLTPTGFIFRRIAGKEKRMALSARNQLQGTVEDVRLGEIMAHVVVRVGQNLIESVITRSSAEELALKKGDAVSVVIKSTEVMVQKG